MKRHIKSFISKVTLEGFAVGVFTFFLAYVASEVITHYFRMQHIKSAYPQETWR